MEALAEADKNYKEAVAEAQKTLGEALAESAKTLAESLADIQKTYNEALDQIAKDTQERIDALKDKLKELADALRELGAKQAAADAIKNAPKYVPYVPPIVPTVPVVPTTPDLTTKPKIPDVPAGRDEVTTSYTIADAMKKTGAASEAEYLRESGGINITQNISYPTASVSEISAQTLSAIKFGTSGGYTASYSSINSRDR